jgi:hypothetical protein
MGKKAKVLPEPVMKVIKHYCRSGSYLELFLHFCSGFHKFKSILLEWCLFIFSIWCKGNFIVSYEFWIINFHSFKGSFLWSFIRIEKATFDIPLKKPKYEISHSFLYYSPSVHLHKTNKYDTFFEKEWKSTSYQETIVYYKLLADDFPLSKWKKWDWQIAGTIAHGFNPEKQFDFEIQKK